MSDLEKEDIIIFETDCTFLLQDNNDEVISKGEGKIQLKEAELIISPRLKETIFVNYRDIINFYENEYKIYFNLTSSETLSIFDLGYKFEDFIRIFSGLYNELMLKDMLMHETLRKSGVESEAIFIDREGKETKYEKCEPRLYETGMVLIPDKGKLKRIAYSDVIDIKDDDFKLSLVTEAGEKIILKMMGRDFEPFVKSLSQIINELSAKVQASMKELLPSVNPSVLRRISSIMKEGKAAKREDIESISKELWNELENKIKQSDIKEEYDFLKSMAKVEKVSIGLKRGLLGDLTGEYIWFLIPVYGEKNKNYGNAIAMEAISGDEGGRATYFFRIMSRKEYSDLKDEQQINIKMDDFIKQINRCMLAINFRREPIYLPEQKLMEPQYERYRFAIAKIPELQNLRELFIGRVIHSSFEQWQKDVVDLLKFNINEKDDNKKWQK